MWRTAWRDGALYRDAAWLAPWRSQRETAAAIADAAVSDITGSVVTITGTSPTDLAGGVFGVLLGIGIGAAPSVGENVAGDASAQEIAIDLADYGVAAGSVVNAAVYHITAADYAEHGDIEAVRIYANALVPVVASAAIAGTATEGETLTGSHGFIVGGYPMMLTQQWRACDGAGANCADISGADEATYELTADEVGDTLRYTQTATNAAGADTATSDATAQVEAAVTATDPQYDASSEQVSGFAFSISWTHTPVGTPTGVAILVNTTGTPDTVTYGGVSCTLHESITNGSSGHTLAIYGLADPPAGAQTVVVTPTGAASIAGIAITVTDGNTDDVFTAATNESSGSSTGRSLAVDTEAGELVVDACQWPTGTTLTPDGGQDLRQQQDGHSNVFLASSTKTAVGASTTTGYTWSPGSDQSTMVSAVFKRGGV